jgi:hypothetical protein
MFFKSAIVDVMRGSSIAKIWLGFVSFTLTCSILGNGFRKIPVHSTAAALFTHATDAFLFFAQHEVPLVSFSPNTQGREKYKPFIEQYCPIEVESLFASSVSKIGNKINIGESCIGEK